MVCVSPAAALLGSISPLFDGKTVGGCQLGEVVDVTAHVEHIIPSSFQNRSPLIGSEQKAIEIAGLIGFECRPIFHLYQRHAEHVEMISDARHSSVEQRSAGNIFERTLGHALTS